MTELLNLYHLLRLDFGVSRFEDYRCLRMHPCPCRHYFPGLENSSVDLFTDMSFKTSMYSWDKHTYSERNLQITLLPVPLHPKPELSNCCMLIVLTVQWEDAMVEWPEPYSTIAIIKPTVRSKESQNQLFVSVILY